MKLALSIALGGSLGALSRYYLSRLVSERLIPVFPAGTLVVNLLGCLLIGFFYGLFDKAVVPEGMKALISVGFIGAFTTFSTFALENINLMRDGETAMALANILASNLFGLLAVLLGITVAGLLFQK